MVIEKDKDVIFSGGFQCPARPNTLQTLSCGQEEGEYEHAHAHTHGQHKKAGSGQGGTRKRE